MDFIVTKVYQSGQVTRRYVDKPALLMAFEQMLELPALATIIINHAQDSDPEVIERRAIARLAAEKSAA